MPAQTSTAPKAASAELPWPTSVERTVSPAPEEVRAIRLESTQWLTGSCRMPRHRVELLAVIVSELMTNALLHSRADRPVTYRSCSPEPGVVRIEVDDATPATVPSPQAAREYAESGRGLFLVDALIGELDGTWGFSPDGSVAWCLVSVEDIPAFGTSQHM
ncbi:ATP-binding protein [Streptomyces sp. NBC_00006]|uniref:ATP-binding protein n=1 Tax=unclassified Streptomyces TaxID=2593676 RepID=UPI00225C288C|nr:MULTISPECIES: ATP-binding protein [unclassified Streptomyces]MCX5529881.1 ATP-binding protein [Streptomyces sp. NBC_00006]